MPKGEDDRASEMGAGVGLITRSGDGYLSDRREMARRRMQSQLAAQPSLFLPFHLTDERVISRCLLRANALGHLESRNTVPFL